MIYLILSKEYGIYKMLLETCKLNVWDPSFYIHCWVLEACKLNVWDACFYIHCWVLEACKLNVWDACFYIRRWVLEACKLNVWDASMYIVGHSCSMNPWPYLFSFVDTWLEENPYNELSHGLIKFSIYYHPFLEFWQGRIPLST
jgi:hypothetical protein